MSNLETNEFSVTGLPVVRKIGVLYFIQYNDATKDRMSYLYLCKKLGYKFLHFKAFPYKNPTLEQSLRRLQMVDGKFCCHM